MYHTILFDLDGTVTNSKEGITKCVQYALKSFGIIEPDLDKLECFIGPPLGQSFMKYYGLSKEDADKAVAKYRERYQPVGIYENTIYDGMEELLSSLKAAGKCVALATSKPEVYAEEILSSKGLSKYFDIITGSLLDGRRTNKEDVIREVLLRLQYNEEQKKGCIMIGDREHDIIGAKAVSIPSIGIRYGFAKGSELWDAGADYVLDTVADVKSFLLT